MLRVFVVQDQLFLQDGTEILHLLEVERPHSHLVSLLPDGSQPLLQRASALHHGGPGLCEPVVELVDVAGELLAKLVVLAQLGEPSGRGWTGGFSRCLPYGEPSVGVRSYVEAVDLFVQLSD